MSSEKYGKLKRPQDALWKREGCDGEYVLPAPISIAFSLKKDPGNPGVENLCCCCLELIERHAHDCGIWHLCELSISKLLQDFVSEFLVVLNLQT